jgi:ubiquinone/menaquinone biosynthesis C-methylase UbiE
MSDLYENTENILAHSSVTWQQKVIADFIRKASPNRFGTCLDAGSGIGNNIETLSAHCETIHAMDISMGALESLRQRHAGIGKRLIVQKMDMASLNYPNESFDLVVCTEVLEHCVEPRMAIEECARVLKPGGSLIVSCPNYLNPAGLYKKIYESVHPHKAWDVWGNHDKGRENFVTSLKLGSWTKSAGFLTVSSRGGDLIRSWLPFLRKHYETIDRHPCLGVGLWWPLRLCMMNYFILARKPSSRR